MYRGIRIILFAGLALLTSVETSAQQKEDETLIEAQALGSALQVLAEEYDLQVLFESAVVANHMARAIPQGTSRDAALGDLLAGTDLTYEFVNERTVAIRGGEDEAVSKGERGDSDSKKLTPSPTLMAQASINNKNSIEKESEDHASFSSEEEANKRRTRTREEAAAEELVAREKRGLIDTIVVIGSRNVGVRRFEDDPQPYVIFNTEDLQASSATNLEDFFRTRLPQATGGGSNREFTSTTNLLGAFIGLGNVSDINLRGLGSEQTLILVNGRRMPRVSLGFSLVQADINGIPLNSIERIEVLPSTASGIYGGGATGGVINIITRRDFVGGEVLLEYGNTFDTDLATRRIEGSYGFALEDGKTNVLMSASYSDAADLLARNRDFGRNSRELLFRNDPSVLDRQFVAISGQSPNIRTYLSSDALVLDNGTALGSDRTFVPLGYQGIASDDGAALVNNAGSYNLELSDSADAGAQRLVQAPTISSVAASVRREFVEHVEAFVEASFYRNEGQRTAISLPSSIILDADDPGNPFQQSVSVVFPNIGPSFDSESVSETLQFISGVTVDLPKEWTLSADYNWSRSRFESVGVEQGFNNDLVEAAIRSGELDVFRDTSAFPLDLSPYAFTTPNSLIGPRDNILQNVALRLSGPAYDLPAGSINVSALLEYRIEDVKGSFWDRIDRSSAPPGDPFIQYNPPREQSVDSIYIESLVPIFSKRNAIPFFKELDLQFSLRRDSYSTKTTTSFGPNLETRGDPIPELEFFENSFTSRDITVGFRWKPIDDVLLRASYATGFLPPNTGQIFPVISEPGFAFLTDPKRENSATFLIVDRTQAGGDPDLMPEESESWSFGAIFEPRFIPGFRLSADYTLIDKTNEIGFISEQDLFNLEDELIGRIERAPLTDEDIAAGFTGGRITFINNSQLNIAKTKSESIDFQIDQVFDTDRYGLFNIFAVATYTLNVEQQITRNSEVRDSVEFDGGPLKWRANAGIAWDSPDGRLSVTWNTQFYDDYLVYSNTDSSSLVEQKILQQGSERIDSELYHDLSAVYRPTLLFGSSSFLTENLELRLGIQNVLDKEPATRPELGSRGRFSVYGDPRLRRYTLSIRKGF